MLSDPTTNFEFLITLKLQEILIWSQFGHLVLVCLWQWLQAPLTLWLLATSSDVWLAVLTWVWLEESFWSLGQGRELCSFWCGAQLCDFFKYHCRFRSIPFGVSFCGALSLGKVITLDINASSGLSTNFLRKIVPGELLVKRKWW